MQTLSGLSLASAPPLAEPLPRRSSTQGTALGFALFLLVNATLFLRPGDLDAGLQEWSIYQAVILTCFVFASATVLPQLNTQALVERPITLCVLGLWAAAVLSHLSHANLYDARMIGWEFGKIVLYFLLFLGLVNSPARLGRFLTWLGVFAFLLTVLALLQHHEVIDNPALAAHRERALDKETGEEVTIERLSGAGIFGNPNDLSRILAAGIVVCLFRLSDRRASMMRLAWGGPLVVFGYALLLTQSRGGLAALVVSLLVLVHAWVGTRKTLLIALVAGTLLLLSVEGRLTEITADEGTGQQRIQLWGEGLAALREEPLFGIGANNYAEMVGSGLGAHNSFVHSFTELGLVGGTCFVSAFALVLWGCYQAGRGRERIPNPELRRMQPFIFALVAGYVAGMVTSSRCYVVPTYLVLACGAAYLRLLRPYLPRAVPRLSGALALRLLGVSAAMLVSIYVFVRMFAHWS